MAGPRCQDQTPTSSRLWRDTLGAGICQLLIKPSFVPLSGTTEGKVGKNMFHTTYTSESVCSGHPDKICDKIADTVLDEAIKQDKYSRVAVECLVSENSVFMAGEVTTQAKLNYKQIARDVIKKLGYTDPVLKFTNRSPIRVNIHTQSPDIACGVNKKGAGDQGMMFGYACSETKFHMPLSISIAHNLTRKVDEVREKKILPYLRPDGKAQTTINYHIGKAVDVNNIVLAVPHKKSVNLETLKHDLYKNVVVPVLKEFNLKISKNNVIVNGTGVWHFSGPAADTGVTGRKIVVDSYGSIAHVGGGAFSGKDPTKVDRSGAYAARFLAKNIVAHGLAKKCEVRLAYFIGAIKPVMQEVETFGTEKKPLKIINDFMNKILDTSVAGIINGLNLLQPIYAETASYGHFGRDQFPWEKIAEL